MSKKVMANMTTFTVLIKLPMRIGGDRPGVSQLLSHTVSADCWMT